MQTVVSWTLILCDFYGRLSSGRQLGSDAVMPGGGGSMTLMVTINHPGWLQVVTALLVSHSPILLFKIGL